MQGLGPIYFKAINWKYPIGLNTVEAMYVILHSLSINILEIKTLERVNILFSYTLKIPVKASQSFLFSRSEMI